jgi:hypothetical protein
MMENIPKSVRLAIKAAAKDVEGSVRGGAYSVMAASDMANTLEKMMLGIVAQSYPRVKSAWMDSDVDDSWTDKKTINPDLVDGQELQQAFERLWKDLDPADRRMLESVNYSKFNAQPKTKLQKENPALYKAYTGSDDLGVKPKEDLGLGLDKAPAPGGIGDILRTPEEKPKAKLDEGGKDIPSKQKLMPPGQVGKVKEDREFETGLPSASL